MLYDQEQDMELNYIRSHTPGIKLIINRRLIDIQKDKKIAIWKMSFQLKEISVLEYLENHLEKLKKKKSGELHIVIFAITIYLI